MSDITPFRRNIQLEGAQFRSAVSEALIQQVGGAINFINDFQFNIKDFNLNGHYALNVEPLQVAADGLFIPPQNIEIFFVSMWNYTQGSSGTTELDIQIATSIGGSFSSIFTTTPKITSAAGGGTGPIWIYTGSAVSNTTAPVLSQTPLSIPAFSAIRVDLVQSQGGTPENAGISIFYRPVN